LASFIKQPFWNRRRGTGPLSPVFGGVARLFSNGSAVEIKGEVIHQTTVLGVREFTVYQYSVNCKLPHGEEKACNVVFSMKYFFKRFTCLRLAFC
jgi:hypothetical protein